jgi:cytochrome c oxidase cbb3-type subunit 4
MDLNDIRSGVTLLSFVLFIGLVRWAWTARRRAAFDEAAHLPFEGEGEGSDRHEEAQR